MKIEFTDLRAQYAHIKQKVDRAIDGVLTHGQFIMGPEVGELERRLASYVGVKHCIGISDGTTALLVAMMALGIKPGDEVITTPFTFIATGEMIALLGARPVFVDIDPRSYNLDPNKVEAAITSRTRAILPVSLYGQCAPFDDINAIAARHDLPVIEDAAQSFGATYKGRRSCGLTTVATTSFFPSKPLGCYGDGGACFTDSDELSRLIRQISLHGQDRRYHHPLIGLNGRLDTIQAAVLLAKLDVFDDEIELRRKVAERYTELLRDLVQTPYESSVGKGVFAQYTIELEGRDAIQRRLKEAGIPTAIHYPTPLNLQPAFAFLDKPQGAFPISERAAGRVLSLPMHPYIDDAALDRIAAALVDAVSSTAQTRAHVN